MGRNFKAKRTFFVRLREYTVSSKKIRPAVLISYWQFGTFAVIR
jgi:hypothetical protein